MFFQLFKKNPPKQTEGHRPPPAPAAAKGSGKDDFVDWVTGASGTGDSIANEELRKEAAARLFDNDGDDTRRTEGTGRRKDARRRKKKK